ncbi:MAG: VCBS repeat-containing protein [Deltaproteobacteria bacterium]|nr:VCBS repeat-containing protein [Deltaproteobacteria bacterium]
MKRMMLPAAAALIALCVPAFGQMAAEVGKDFQPVSGYVVTPMQGDYLIDLDAKQGVGIGDLFAVVQAGEKIVHPVTKQVVGSVESAKAYLQVTRVQSGYSYARVVGKIDGARIEAGNVVRRYQNLPVRFWDYSGRGEGLFAELKNVLPHLEWVDYAAAQASRPAVPAPSGDQGVSLTFIYDGARLEARDPYFQIIRSYGAAAAAALAAPARPAAAGSGMKLQPLPGAGSSAPAYSAPAYSAPAPAAAPSAPLPYKLDERPLTAAAGGVQYEAAFPGFKKVGDLPPGTSFSDFVVADGRRLMACVNGNNLFVFDISEGMQRLGHATLPYTVDLLSVRWWKPSPTDPLHLAVTGWVSKEDSQKLSSAVFVLEGKGGLRLLEDRIGYILGSLDHDGDGLPEILLAQDFSNLTFFGARYYRYTLVKGKLRQGAPGISLPNDLAVVSGRCIDLTGNGKPEFAFVRNNILYIYSSDGKKRIWESNKQMGGSLSQAMHVLQKSDARKTGISDVTSLEVPPAAADLDGDGRPELVILSLEKVAWGIAEGAVSGVKKSWLGVVKFREGMFVKGTIGEALEIPLAGVTVTGQEVLFIATEPPELLGKKGTSYLLSFPLK